MKKFRDYAKYIAIDGMDEVELMMLNADYLTTRLSEFGLPEEKIDFKLSHEDAANYAIQLEMFIDEYGSLANGIFMSDTIQCLNNYKAIAGKN